MQLYYYPYTIKLKQRFTISKSSRLTTPAVMVEIEHDGLIGYGEAALPPYLKENPESVMKFLQKIKLEEFKNDEQFKTLIERLDLIDDGNNAAKAAVDIALHDLMGKMFNVSLSAYLNIDVKKELYSSYTIGISDEETLKHNLEKAAQFKFLKIKLGTNNDKQIIDLIRSITDKPIYVDVNQGWRDKYFALDMIEYLKEQNVILVEQPLPKSSLNDITWLSERVTLPIIADEDVQDLKDFERIRNVYTGINIKLMKAGGINKAYKMCLKARELNLKVMLGCMTETSCAITAASHISPLADWIDLDGAELISNDLFSGMKFNYGKIEIPKGPGLGIEKL